MTTNTSWTHTADWLHFRRFLAHPVRLASVVASSQTLGRLIAEQIRRADDEYVVELGAGTGAVTRAILASVVPADKLIVVEIDTRMAQFLRTAFPTVSVIAGCALDIEQSLPPLVVGRVGAVVCGLPMSLSPLHEQRRLAAVMLSLMPPDRRFLLYTHRLTSPVPAAKLGLVGERLAFTLRNFPPASVWAFGPAAQ